MSPLWRPVTLWAVRDLMRRPWESGITAVALATLVVFAGTVLLLSQALSDTLKRIFDHGPDVVIRRFDAGGWMPVPIQTGLDAVKTVPGVLKPRARIWGSVQGPTRFFTVMGVDGQMRDALSNAHIMPPSKGCAVAGTAAASDMAAGVLVLNGARSMAFSVTALLPGKFDMTAHDMVLVHPADARRLLGISEGFATDLTISVFHPAEAALLVPELLDALPWRARAVLLKDVGEAVAGGFGRLGGIGLLVVFPALFALVLLLLTTVRSRLGRKAETGLLKAMGWRTCDIVRLYTTQSFLIAMPATAGGLVAAYGLVFWPGLNWVPFLFFGWRQTAPPLFLSAAGAGSVLLQVAVCVLLPYGVAGWWAAYRAASADPADLLPGGRWL